MTTVWLTIKDSVGIIITIFLWMIAIPRFIVSLKESPQTLITIFSFIDPLHLFLLDNKPL